MLNEEITGLDIPALTVYDFDQHDNIIEIPMSVEEFLTDSYEGIDYTNQLLTSRADQYIVRPTGGTILPTAANEQGNPQEATKER